MFRLFMLVLGLTLAGSVNSAPPNSRSWTDLGVDGLILDLQDSKTYERYSFGPNGIVAAGVGEKKGLVAAPVFFWKLKRDILIIDDEDGKPVESLRLIEVRPSSLVAERRDGTMAVYSIKRR